jgi:2-phospho-L-lactate guanylyltransferase
MARDVVAALLAAGNAPRQLLLVSEDADVAALADALGVGLFRPRPATRDPLNAALQEASAHARACGATSVLMLHADLPAASAGSLRALWDAHAARTALPRATLVTDRAGSGSNCLLLTPPGCIALCFGADSRARHRAAAAAAHADYTEFTQGHLAMDVDLAEDLRALVRFGQTPDNACGAHTRAWLGAHPAS